MPLINYLQLQQYYEKLLELKQWYFRSVKTRSRYVLTKIWSRWLIVNLAESPPFDYQLINLNRLDQLQAQTVQELVEKRIPELEAQNFYRDWSCLLRTHLKSFQSLVATSHSLDHLNPKEYHYPVIQVDFDADQVNLQWGDLPEFQIPVNQYRRLERHFIPNPEIILANRTRQFHFELWRQLFSYYYLDGLSLQWSIPQSTFRVLSHRFDLRAELFASPMNSFLPQYYSLFPSDRSFGSQGNFFHINHLLRGAYQVNPPFIESIFIRSSQIVIGHLVKAFQRSIPLTFIYVMPDWTDSRGYQQLVNSYFCRAELVLEARKHYYYETQSQRYVPATFASHVIILSTERGMCNSDLLAQIEESFQHPEGVASRGGGEGEV